MRLLSRHQLRASAERRAAEASAAAEPSAFGRDYAVGLRTVFRVQIAARRAWMIVVSARIS